MFISGRAYDKSRRWNSGISIRVQIRGGSGYTLGSPLIKDDQDLDHKASIVLGLFSRSSIRLILIQIENPPFLECFFSTTLALLQAQVSLQFWKVFSLDSLVSVSIMYSYMY